MTKMTLKDLTPGEKARVARINKRNIIGRRLIEMGVSPGCEVKVERYAPLGDPIEIKLKGTHISLRKVEAEIVEVEKEC
ncbi:MAG: FeoA family protein [Bacillota bacterium]|jgi:Fe2+ transport system protein FeoA|nr:ferrous iron transport protein A [Clostridia bacterium]